MVSSIRLAEEGTSQLLCGQSVIAPYTFLISSHAGAFSLKPSIKKSSSRFVLDWKKSPPTLALGNRMRENVLIFDSDL